MRKLKNHIDHHQVIVQMLKVYMKAENNLKNIQKV